MVTLIEISVCVKSGGILYWIFREQLTEVIFEWRPEGGKGVKYEDETLR